MSEEKKDDGREKLKKPVDGRMCDIIKSIAGFMNSFKGGELVIGYDDDNDKVIGIEVDYPYTGSKEWDSWENTLIQTCVSNLGGSATKLCLKSPEQIIHKGKTIAIIIILASAKPVYIKDTEFFVRFPGQTRKLVGPEADNYKKERFGNH